MDTAFPVHPEAKTQTRICSYLLYEAPLDWTLDSRGKLVNKMETYANTRKTNKILTAYFCNPGSLNSGVSLSIQLLVFMHKCYACICSAREDELKHMGSGSV